MDNLKTILKSNAASLIEGNFDVLEDAVWKLAPGGAINGPPTTGSHEQDEKWLDQNHAIWVCITAGTPGTWKQLTPGIMTGGSWPGGSIPTGYEAVRTDLDRIRHRYDGSGWIRINRRKLVVTSAASQWDFNHGLGFYPATVTIMIGGNPAHGGIEHVDVNNLSVYFNSNQSGDLIVE